MQNNDVLENVCNGVVRAINKNTSQSINASNYASGMALATVTDTGLLVDGIKQEYPKGDYWILDNLNNPKSIETESAGSTTEHTHKIKIPDNQLPIKTGDRVLVAVMGINAVIVGRVSHG